MLHVYNVCTYATRDLYVAYVCTCDAYVAYVAFFVYM